MIFPDPDKLEKIGSRYGLVTLAAKRAKQIKSGAAPLIETESTNALTIALEEILAGKLILSVPEIDEPTGGIDDPDALGVFQLSVSSDAVKVLQEGSDEDWELSDEDLEDEDIDDDDDTVAAVDEFVNDETGAKRKALIDVTDDEDEEEDTEDEDVSEDATIDGEWSSDEAKEDEEEEDF